MQIKHVAKLINQLIMYLIFDTIMQSTIKY